MKFFIGLLLGLWMLPLVAADQPNILFIIADDASRDSFGAYGCQYVETPGFDRIASEVSCLRRRITAIQSVRQRVPVS